MFDDSEWSLVQAILSTEDFFLPEHQIIFTAIKSVIAKAQHPDPITLTDHLQAESNFKTIGGSNYLSTLTKTLRENSALASNLLAYARIVKDKSLDRQIDTIWTRRDLNDSDKLMKLREAKILLHSHQETLIDATEQMDIPKKESMLFPWLFTRDIWMMADGMRQNLDELPILTVKWEPKRYKLASSA